MRYVVMVYNYNNLRIYMGDTRDALYPELNTTFPWQPQKTLLEDMRFAHLKKMMSLEELVFVRQIHGVDGLHVTRQKAETLHAFHHEADFIITHEQSIGIGVLTADCVPLVIYDLINNVAAIVHAGWRGSVQGVALKALDALAQTFNTQIQNVRIFLAPCAGICCYQIDESLATSIRKHSYSEPTLFQQNNTWFFNLSLFNCLQLQHAGVPQDAFDMQYMACTICSPQFFSYRRQKEKAGRQMTVVSLIYAFLSFFVY